MCSHTKSSGLSFLFAINEKIVWINNIFTNGANDFVPLKEMKNIFVEFIWKENIWFFVAYFLEKKELPCTNIKEVKEDPRYHIDNMARLLNILLICSAFCIVSSIFLKGFRHLEC